MKLQGDVKESVFHETFEIAQYIVEKLFYQFFGCTKKEEKHLMIAAK